MFTSHTQIRVRYAETDQMGAVYHSNYSPYFEMETKSMKRTTMPVQLLEKLQPYFG